VQTDNFRDDIFIASLFGPKNHFSRYAFQYLRASVMPHTPVLLCHCWILMWRREACYFFSLPYDVCAMVKALCANLSACECRHIRGKQMELLTWLSYSLHVCETGIAHNGIGFAV
jgi:hypothetical protein